MKLGDFIDNLALYDDDMVVRFDTGSYPACFDSWRGRYAELTLQPHGEQPMTVVKLRGLAEHADGDTFIGYKGGEFTMNRDTPVWADDYGECRYNAIVGFQVKGRTVVLMTQNIGEYMGG